MCVWMIIIECILHESFWNPHKKLHVSGIKNRCIWQREQLPTVLLNLEKSGRSNIIYVDIRLYNIQFYFNDVMCNIN